MSRDPKPNAFDYAGYFSRIRDLEKLCLRRDEIDWQERFTSPTRPVDVLLYLGCNVLITSHLAIEVVRVFERLGVDFAAVGGPQFCCGIVHHTHGDLGAASRLSQATVEKFQAYRARTLVVWCPSCDLHLNDIVLPSLADDGLGMEVTHTAQFLADRVQELPLAPLRPARVAVHTHEGHARQERDARAVAALMKGVPGVEVVGTVSSERLGYHCGTPTDRESQTAFEAERGSLLDRARVLGADTVATIYHSCQREWCETSSDQLRIRNYISIVAESMGCETEDRYTQLRQSDSPEAMVEASRAQWSSHGWDESRASKAAGSLIPASSSKYRTPNG